MICFLNIDIVDNVRLTLINDLLVSVLSTITNKIAPPGSGVVPELYLDRYVPRNCYGVGIYCIYLSIHLSIYLS